jgi:glycosidase
MRTPQGEVKDFAYRVWLPVASDDHLLLSSTIFPFQFPPHWLRHTISIIVADTGRMFSRHLGKLNTPKAKCVSNERQIELVMLYVTMKQSASLYYGSPGIV